MKGILFNTKMVQAILKNRKTATRRPIKNVDIKVYKATLFDGTVYDRVRLAENEEIIFDGGFKDLNFVVKDYAPHQVGDILYVRETFCYDDFDNGGETIYYKADYGERHLKDLFTDCGMKWKPSIHMPKEASRIFLKVTDVRVERLQDITVEQVKKEGVLDCGQPIEIQDTYADGVVNWYKALFENLWNSTIKKQDMHKYSWEANPYVFCYEFKRINKPEVPKCIQK